MTIETFQATLQGFGFTFKTWEYNGDITIEHPLSDDFYFNLKKDQPLPTFQEIMDDFYHSARRDESNDHHCW